MLDQSILRQLTSEDDPQLWDVATQIILSDAFLFGHTTNVELFAQIGRCNHWIRPHQWRWTAGGGFAVPIGYDKTTTGFSYRAAPELEWSVFLKWTGVAWEPGRFSGRGLILRVAIPGRTVRHQQAAIHTLWTPRSPGGAEKRVQFYGFRKHADVWQLAATFARDPQPQPKKKRKLKRGGVRQIECG
jgi:hypothetical protein